MFRDYEVNFLFPCGESMRPFSPMSVRAHACRHGESGLKTPKLPHSFFPPLSQTTLLLLAVHRQDVQSLSRGGLGVNNFPTMLKLRPLETRWEACVGEDHECGYFLSQLPVGSCSKILCSFERICL